VLALTEDGVALMKDASVRADLALARQRRPTKDRRPERARPDTEAWKDVNHDLFDRLRAVRLRLARARGVPPYVIFHDTTLRELARLKPTTLDALRTVYGIGARKAEQLGEEFTDEIRRFVAGG
jgi:ATP-dependent DNA helicase RecQ